MGKTNLRLQPAYQAVLADFCVVFVSSAFEHERIFGEGVVIAIDDTDARVRAGAGGLGSGSVPSLSTIDRRRSVAGRLTAV